MFIEYQNQPITHLMRNGVDLLAGAGGGDSEGIEEFSVTIDSMVITFYHSGCLVAFDYYPPVGMSYRTGTTLAQVLPEGFRPTENKSFTRYVSINSTSMRRTLTVKPDGTVVASSVSTVSNAYMGNKQSPTLYLTT